MKGVQMLSWDDVERLMGLARTHSARAGFQETMAEVDAELRRMVPSCANVMVPLSAVDLPRTDQGLKVDSSKVAPLTGYLRDYGADDLALYADYMQFDRFAANLFAVQGRVIDTKRLYAPEEFGREPYTAEFMPRSGWEQNLACFLPFGAQSGCTFLVLRQNGQPAFTADEQRLLQLVAPDLARLSRTAILQDQLAQATEFERDASLAAVVLDAQGEALTLTPAAQPLLRRARTSLEELCAWARGVLRAGWGGSASLRLRLDPGGWLQVVFTSLPQLSVIVLNELDAGTEDVFAAETEAAQLTPRQIEVARLAVLGRSNSEIAFELGVSPETVKRHLGAIYQKVKVSGRTELANTLLGGPPA
ncbi:MAG: helix-turn-helix transcriptional regulator [Planctomycetes bacterium]|nr:helix-turn-helix transcriptional regulator [Planctomycetota bacterium]